MAVVINGVEYFPRCRITVPVEMGTLGQAIRRMRKSLKMSLDKAAVEIGCSKSYLWELEHDRAEPGLRMAMSIASAYGVPIQTLAACALVTALPQTTEQLLQKISDFGQDQDQEPARETTAKAVKGIIRAAIQGTNM